MVEFVGGRPASMPTSTSAPSSDSVAKSNSARLMRGEFWKLSVNSASKVEVKFFLMGGESREPWMGRSNHHQ